MSIASCARTPSDWRAGHNVNGRPRGSHRNESVHFRRISVAYTPGYAATFHIGAEEKESEREPEGISLKTNVSSNSSVIKDTVAAIALRSQQIFDSY